MNRVPGLEMLAYRDPSNPDALCELLDALLLQGEVERARQRLIQAPKEVRALPGVCFREARCALMAGDYAQVVDLLMPFRQAAQPVPAGLCHDLAWAQFLLGDSDGALHSLSFAVATGADAIAIHLLKARIWHQQQRLVEALALLDGTPGEDREAERRGLRALLLLDHGQAAEASLEAEQALALDPAQYEACLVNGTLALWARQTDVAISQFQPLVARQPTAGRALLGLGEGLMLRGDIPAALGVLERAASHMSGHIGTWHALAWCQLLLGNLDGAQASFDRAFALDRAFGETHGGRALVHALRGEKALAGEAIKRALRLDPQGRSARYAQSVLLLDEGRESEAQQIVDALASEPLQGQVPIPAGFVHTLRELLRPRAGNMRGH